MKFNSFTQENINYLQNLLQQMIGKRLKPTFTTNTYWSWGIQKGSVGRCINCNKFMSVSWTKLLIINNITHCPKCKYPLYK